jgi:LytS/YehU family sensor histidine kinase
MLKSSNDLQQLVENSLAHGFQRKRNLIQHLNYNKRTHKKIIKVSKDSDPSDNEEGGKEDNVDASLCTGCSLVQVQ